MKKTLLFTGCLLFIKLSIAQSVQDVEQQMYYQQYQPAIHTSQQIIQKDANNADAWYWLTEAYIESGNIDKAKDSLAKAPATVQSSPEYAVAYGSVLLQQGDVSGAQAQFDKAIDDTRGKNADILAGVAKAHIEAPKGNATYAIEVLDKAIKRDKRNPALYILKGDAYRKMNNGSEAYTAYQEALQKKSDDAAALYKLGSIFTTQKNPEMYLKFFNQAVAADSNYAPAYYDLYFHYYFRDPDMAMKYFNKYVAHSDYAPKNDYLHTDLLYLTKQYQPAIDEAKQLLQRPNGDTVPRLYKLMAYSYKELKQPEVAMQNMNQYFAKAPDSNFIAKDFETMAELYAGADKTDSAIAYYEKAVNKQTDSTVQFSYYKNLANLNKKINNQLAQAQWLGKYYQGNPNANNVDLFNWAVANFTARDYVKADSVFAIYTEKYPEQGFGFYWKARSDALIDSTMEKGLAIQPYMKLIEIAEKDTASDTNKKWLVEAYGYIAAYKTNTEKDFATAIDYFNKLLTVDPGNADAKKYIDILEKSMANSNKASTAAPEAGANPDKEGS